jgi:hypothetical protein
MLQNATIRFDAEELRLLKKISEARAENLSTFVRSSVKKELLSLGYLSPKEAKALGFGRIGRLSPCLLSHKDQEKQTVPDP